ncbi:MAG TPA: GcrA family cell cycle regulator [Hyphomicrobiaceae bacterium]|jgi:GcrA cell cycle regulator|nr:GcrA family cell cycle regulator [Hyphomicrobiaceae bacterium]
MPNLHTDTPWTSERCEVLRQLWGEGFSAGQIAAELGGVTRSGVLGKVHRLGLAKHRGPEFRPGPPRPRRQRVRRRMLIPTPPPLPALRAQPRRLQLLQLRDHHCRWPIGDPHGHAFYFCAADRVAGVPYCPFHMGRAFAKPRGSQ